MNDKIFADGPAFVLRVIPDLHREFLRLLRSIAVYWSRIDYFDFEPKDP